MTRPRRAFTGRSRTRALTVRPRSAAAVALVSCAGLVAFCWPLLVSPDSGLAHGTDAPLVFALVLPLLLAVVLAELSEGGMDVKAVAMLGVLAAIGAALRPLGAGTAGLETVFFLLVLGGRVFGAGFGFVLGATTLFASALVTGGVGPWLPFQMLGAAWVGWGAGMLPPMRGRAEVLLLAGYGAVAGLAYGLLLNLSFWPFTTGLSGELSFVAGAPVLENLHRFLVFTLATSLGWDLGRAVTTAVLVLVTGRAVLGALRRAARRAAFEEPVVFDLPPARTADPADSTGSAGAGGGARAVDAAGAGRAADAVEAGRAADAVEAGRAADAVEAGRAADAADAAARHPLGRPGGAPPASRASVARSGP